MDEVVKAVIVAPVKFGWKVVKAPVEFGRKVDGTLDNVNHVARRADVLFRPGNLLLKCICLCCVVFCVWLLALTYDPLTDLVVNGVLFLCAVLAACFICYIIASIFHNWDEDEADREQQRLRNEEAQRARKKQNDSGCRIS